MNVKVIVRSSSSQGHMNVKGILRSSSYECQGHLKVNVRDSKTLSGKYYVKIKTRSVNKYKHDNQ